MYLCARNNLIIIPFHHFHPMADELLFVTVDLSSELPLPYADGGIRAGFPSPAQDYVDKSLDLNRDLIKHPAATFYARVVGDSMEPSIHPGDILVIDRSITPYDRCTAVCFVNGEFTVKYLDLSEKDKGVIWLVPANPNYVRIRVKKEEQFEIWGVVRYVIHDETAR